MLPEFEYVFVYARFYIRERNELSEIPPTRTSLASENAAEVPLKPVTWVPDNNKKNLLLWDPDKTQTISFSISSQTKSRHSF